MEKSSSRLEIFRVALKLGLTSFGGPVAHLGYFHEEYVRRRRWFSEAAFYRSGALVFGGGHVVLPLLQAETVAPGWVGNDSFLAGYGLAQALPGPLFSFSAYLGTVLTPPRPGGWIGAVLCLLAIYLPSGLLVLGVLPFWENLRRRPGAQATLRGANAAVVGLLLAALYNPVWTSAVHTSGDLALALVVFGLLTFWKLPPWMVVGLAAVGGELFLKG